MTLHFQTLAPLWPFPLHPVSSRSEVECFSTYDHHACAERPPSSEQTLLHPSVELSRGSLFGGVDAKKRVIEGQVPLSEQKCCTPDIIKR